MLHSIMVTYRVMHVFSLTVIHPAFLGAINSYETVLVLASAP